MTPNAVAVRCAHCGADYPGTRGFCPGCGKPNLNRASNASFSAAPEIARRQAARLQPAQLPFPAPLPAQGLPQPAGGARSYASPLPAAATPGVEPPMGWEMLLVYSTLSLGVVGIVFAFKQTLWAKRMDPGSAANARLTLACVLPVIAIILMVIAASKGETSPLTVLSLPALMMFIVAIILAVLYVLSMVTTIRAVAQYNGVPLRVRTVWGFLLGALYFQHCIRAIEVHCGAIQNP
jgi:hypothetical protein